jgi:hypothetical protein
VQCTPVKDEAIHGNPGSVVLKVGHCN